MRQTARRKSFIVATMVAAGSLTIGLVPAVADNIGNQGCTPGYWKNHTSNWEEYTPSQKLKTVFTFPSRLSSFGEKTMLQGLQGGGGSGIDGAATILLRASTAAFLNAAHEGVGYPMRRFDDPGRLRQRINAALASLNRDTMLKLATELDKANNLGCPL